MLGNFTRQIMLNTQSGVLTFQGPYQEGIQEKILYQISAGVIYSLKRFSKIFIEYDSAIGYLNAEQQPMKQIAIFVLDTTMKYSENSTADIYFYQYKLLTAAPILIDSVQTISLQVTVSGFENNQPLEQTVPWDEVAYAAEKGLQLKFEYNNLILTCDKLE